MEGERKRKNNKANMAKLMLSTDKHRFSIQEYSTILAVFLYV